MEHGAPSPFLSTSHRTLVGIRMFVRVYCTLPSTQNCLPSSNFFAGFSDNIALCDVCCTHPCRVCALARSRKLCFLCYCSLPQTKERSLVTPKTALPINCILVLFLSLQLFKICYCALCIDYIYIYVYSPI